MSNAHRIFNLFNPIPSKVDEEMENELREFETTPYYKIGMFTKILNNGNNFKTEIINFISKSDKDLDPENIKSAGDFIMYNRAYYWISQFDIDDKKWISNAREAKSNYIEEYIDDSIRYFESIEEYEKCAILVKILNTIK
jgi:hypothetical protein